MFRGRKDVPLNKVGKMQAKTLAAHLAVEKIDAVYSSPLSRALETAKEIAAPHHLEVVTEAGLIDMSFGVWEGEPADTVSKKHASQFRVWKRTPHSARIPRGETLAEVRRRAVKALEKVSRRHKGGKVVVVAHRVVNKVLVLHALGLPNSRFWDIMLDTCSLNRIMHEKNKYVILAINETCHMKGFDFSRADF